MKSTVCEELRDEGRAELLREQIRLRLGKSKKTDALVSPLTACKPEVADKLSRLLVGKKSRGALFAAIEKVLAELPSG